MQWSGCDAGAGSGHLGRSGTASCGGGTEPALKAEEEWGVGAVGRRQQPVRMHEGGPSI